MKQFENKVLFIENEETLEDLGDIIFEEDFSIDWDTFFLGEDTSENYLYFDFEIKKFGISNKVQEDQEITLQQFKELLNQSK